jgi:hypothetical protein
MPVQPEKQQEFECPFEFNGGNRVYPTKRLAAQHLSTIKSNDGDELHPINHDLYIGYTKEGGIFQNTHSTWKPYCRREESSG